MVAGDLGVEFKIGGMTVPSVGNCYQTMDSDKLASSLGAKWRDGFIWLCCAILSPSVRVRVRLATVKLFLRAMKG